MPPSCLSASAQALRHKAHMHATRAHIAHKAGNTKQAEAAPLLMQGKAHIAHMRAPMATKSQCAFSVWHSVVLTSEQSLESCTYKARGHELGHVSSQACVSMPASPHSPACVQASARSGTLRNSSAPRYILSIASACAETPHKCGIGMPSWLLDGSQMEAAHLLKAHQGGSRG